MIEDELDHDLSAWEPPPPPDGLADAVLARMGGTQVTPAVPNMERRATERRTWLIAGVAAACLAASAGTYALIRSSRPAGQARGEVVATSARTLALDGVHAELDPGADVRWQRHGDVLNVEQRAGAAAWRVDDDTRLLIDAGVTVASVDATGASLRVEVQMNATDPLSQSRSTLGATALAAAAVSLVSVTVYTGHVKVSDGGQTVIVQPGSTYSVTPVLPASPPAPEATHELVGGGPRVASSGTTLDRQAISQAMGTVRSQLTTCAALSTSSGTVKVMVKVRPDGKVDALSVSQTFDAKVSSCILDLIKKLQFPATDTGGSFTYPFVVGNGSTTVAQNVPPVPPVCDSDELKEQGMEAISLGDQVKALERFEASLQCKFDPYVVQLAFMSACSSKNAAKARVYYPKLAPAQQSKFAAMCTRNGIDVAKLAQTCDGAALKDKGIEQINLGQHEEASRSFEQAYDCNGDPTLPLMITSQACAAKDRGKATTWFARLPADQQKKVADYCASEGVTLTPTATMAATQRGVGYLVLASKPPAKILIDGVDTGKTTPVAGNALPLKPGKHRVTFVVGDDRFTYAITITAGQTVRLVKDLQ